MIVSNGVRYEQLIRFFQEKSEIEDVSVPASLGYFVQAEQQLPEGLWKLMKQDTPQTPSLQEYLKSNSNIRRLAVDAFSTSITVIRQLKDAGFSLAKSSEAALDDSRRLVVALQENPVDKVWGSERPALPRSEVYIHPKEFSGATCCDKVEKAVQEMARENADLLLLSSLDDVAWLTNLRGSDSSHSPTFSSYALLARTSRAANASDQEQAWRLLVYTDVGRVNAEAKASLAASGAALRDYNELAGDLERILATQEQQGGSVAAVDALLASHAQQQKQQQQQQQQQTKVTRLESGEGRARAREFVWLDPKVNAALHQIVAERREVLLKETPVAVAKAAKSPVELRGVAEAHELDGLALATFFCWFEKQLLVNAQATQQQQQQQRQQQLQECVLTEWTIKEAVDFARMTTCALCRGPSFSSISCFGSNCALAHYRPQPESSFLLKAGLPCRPGGPPTVKVVTRGPPEGSAREEVPIFLLDSGGQYLGGTTDVTRTMHLGSPTKRQREAFTLVLKGVIGLTSQKFPEGVKGPQLDALARQHLWNAGLDYMHGTGHGVGHFLNVHEGPIGISSRLSSVQGCYELQPGTVVSIEPGFYHDGEFGIRTENLVAVEKCPLSYRGRGFLQFSTLTLVPIQTKMIDFSLLTPQEMAWLDSYHAEVYSKISRRLKTSAPKVSVTNEEVDAWLTENTRTLKELMTKDSQSSS
ncbi:hypothetical protein Esti_005742 [Eimeria stiedai]